MRKYKKGFTLVELLAILVVLGIIIVVAMPALVESNRVAENNKIKDFKNRALHPSNAITRGTAQNDDIYFQNTEVRNKYYNDVTDIVLAAVRAITKSIYRTEYSLTLMSSIALLNYSNLHTVSPYV